MPIERHLGLYYNPDVMNKEVMNMVEQVSLKLDVKSYGHMPTSGVVGSYGTLIFSFMRILHRFLE